MKRFVSIKALFCALLVCLSLAQNSTAQLYGWGHNGWGQLGIGSIDNQSYPQQITGASDTTGISAHASRTLFLKADGRVYAAGHNFGGQLGTGTTNPNELFALPVQNLTNVTQVSMGSMGLARALKEDGTVWRWGNYLDQASISVPVQEPLENIVQIASGWSHFVALKSDGTVWADGSNYWGEIGDGSHNFRANPVQVGADVPGFNNIIAIDAYTGQNIALKADGTVWGWGINYHGILVGDGSLGERVTRPVKYAFLNDVVQVAAGAAFNVALKRDGTVWVWGNPNLGAFGNGTSDVFHKYPQQAAINDVVEIKASAWRVIVRKRDGSVWGWGDNSSDAVASCVDIGIDCLIQPLPVQNPSATGYALIGLGMAHGFAGKPSFQTRIGKNIRVYGENVSMILPRVRISGITRYNAIDPTSVASNIPAGYVLQANQPAYEVSTTAAIQGEIQVCLKVPNEFDQTQFSLLRILHSEGASWTDRTFSSDYTRRQICARVTTSPSSFVIAKPVSAIADDRLRKSN